MKRYSFLWLLVAVVAMTSCQDEFIKNENKSSDKIGYAVETNSISEPLKSRASRSTDNTDVTIEELDQTLGGMQLYLHTITDMVMPMDIKAEKKKDTKNPQSRGAITYTGDVKNIGVTSIVWNGTSWGDSGTERKLYMDNVVAEKNSSFQTNYYWPAAEQHIRFFAYHPADAVSIANSDDKSTQTIEWTVPKVVANQHDLLVASSDYAGDYKATADLFFGHALTAVQFKLSNEITGVTVTAVRIKGVKYKGTYTYDYCGRNGDDGDSDTGDTDAGTWEVEDGTNDFEVSGLTDKAEDLFAEDRGEDKGIINYGENTFMMMPQTLPDCATIEVDVIDNGAATPETQTLTATIGKKVWQKGTKVIYTVSFNNSTYILEVLNEDGNKYVNNQTYQYYGGWSKYFIQSYLVKIGGKVEPVKWAVTEMSGVDCVTGLEGNGVSDTGSKEGQTAEKAHQFGILPGTLSSTSHVEHGKLKENASVTGTYDNPVDLSTHEPDYLNEISRHTANCYLVRYPGYYKFPLVYGNAIKDGVDNPSAYRSKFSDLNPATSSNWTFSAVRYVATNSAGYALVTKKDTNNGQITVQTLDEFRDHVHGEDNTAEGNDIKGPWIADQELYFPDIDYTPASAEIVWQDAPGLVSDVRLMKPIMEDGKDRHYISFNVDEKLICNGNAVIAVKNAAGHIMWSWHIWVSDIGTFNSKTITNRRVLGNYKAGDTDATKWTREENEFNLFPRMLGLCYGENRSYAESGGKIKFQQVDENGEVLLGGASAVIEFIVSAHEFSVGTGTPTYQWGRKDPIRPAVGNTADGNYANNKTWFGHDRKPHAGESIPKTASPGLKNISVTIQNPGIFFMDKNSTTNNYVTTRNWCTQHYINLWNANCNQLPMFSYHSDLTVDEYHNQFNNLVDIPVVKTVYDPCPPGWEMPRIDAFSGLTLTGMRAKPYYKTPGDKQTVCDDVNIGWHDKYVGNFGELYELAFYRNPMVGAGIWKYQTDNAATNPNLYWTVGLGMRRNTGNSEYYAIWGTMLTNSVTCIQSILEDGEHSGKFPEFEYKSSRLCFIQNSTTSENGEVVGYGTIRPFSFSNVDMSFGVIPVKTGSNPIRTEVKVGGDINQWVDGDHIDMEF